MPLFRSSASGVGAEALASTLVLRITEQFRVRHGYTPGVAEQRAWERSLPVLARDLVDAGLGDVEMLIEYQLPLSSKRIDAVLAGIHPKTGRPSYVLIELKQWSSATASVESPTLCTIEGYGHHEVLHPGEQVRRYCLFLLDFTQTLVDEPDSVAGAAYLHNATDFGVSTLYDLPEDEHGRVFTGEKRAGFHEFLRSRLAPQSGAEAADLLQGSRIAPSKQLLALAAEEIQSREQFTLLDEQQVAYVTVLRAVERARRADNKEVVVVTGGPGSGKSVIALSLLGELSRQKRAVAHATGSRSFTLTLRKVAGRRAPRVQALFRYFNNFVAAEPNDLDVLICDEAHRIRETSANRFTKAQHRTGRSQVEELISAARVPVFLLDEHQVVRPGEIGTVADIKAAAADLGVPVRTIDLDGQFRCGGSEAYLQWVLRLLGLAPGGPVAWEGDEHFTLLLAESPDEMEAMLAAQSSDEYAARMSAGFCWPWSDPRPDGTLVDDVVIGSWHRPWNVKGDKAVGGAPPSALWSTDPAGFGQVGCIYTAQGFEYDWSGVILGPDLVWRSGAWVADRSATQDPAFKRGKADTDFDYFVRNVYKVLLTRGMIGSVVHSTDTETQDFLRSLVLAPQPIGRLIVDQVGT